jgi:hypothetical protein
MTSMGEGKVACNYALKIIQAVKSVTCQTLGMSGASGDNVRFVSVHWSNVAL